MRYPIPNSLLAEGHVAILGMTGRGKTTAAKHLVERHLDHGHQVIVLDPQGIWCGLKTAADGAHVGKRILIIGGQNADIPLDAATPRELAQFVMASKASVVLDFFGMYLDGMHAIAADFLQELFDKNIDRRSYFVVLEEADVWAPQSTRSRLAHAVGVEVDRYARHGRGRGFRLITICQRTAKINKDILSQAQTYLFFGLAGLIDRRVARDMVEGVAPNATEVFNTLPSLEVGEAWVWLQTRHTLSREKFPMHHTLDNSQTPSVPHRSAPPPFAKDEIDALRALMSEITGRGKPSLPRQRKAPAPTAAGQAIAELREALRLTQGELGERIGSDQTSISRIEAGRVKPGTDILERIAEATGRRLVIDFRAK